MLGMVKAPQTFYIEQWYAKCVKGLTIKADTNSDDFNLEGKLEQAKEESKTKEKRR